jgi:hypothetical protein
VARASGIGEYESGPDSEPAVYSYRPTTGPGRGLGGGCGTRGVTGLSLGSLSQWRVTAWSESGRRGPGPCRAYRRKGGGTPGCGQW